MDAIDHNYGSDSQIQLWFEYSEDSSFSSIIDSERIEYTENGEWSIALSRLDADTPYHYRFSLYQSDRYDHNEKEEYFESQSLVTAPCSMMISDITLTTAVCSGNVSLPNDGSMQFGIRYSTTDDFTKWDEKVSQVIIEPDSSGNFTYMFDDLLPNQTYYYCYYYAVPNSNGDFYIAYQSEKQSFTTLYPDLNNSKDLSQSETANCYIISHPGRYKIKAVKGNSNEPVGDIGYAEVLWESFGTDVAPNVGDLVSYAVYKDDYIYFATPETFAEGNAVIAAKNTAGKILWSWHIWLTDEPKGQVYYNNAGTMMDRNLGATSNIPGEVGALGLLYQWGRKDPFLGSSSISSSTESKATITFPSAVSSSSSKGTIGYAIANPTTFIAYNGKNNDWYYTGSRYYTDNTRWQAEKTMYDPCPQGWRVPDGGKNGVWATAASESSFKVGYSTYEEGINFSGTFGEDAEIWYSASGSRSYTSGRLENLGNYGCYWSFSPSSGFYEAFYLYFYDSGSGSSLGRGGGRASGYAVRCLQE